MREKQRQTDIDWEGEISYFGAAPVSVANAENKTSLNFILFEVDAKFQCSQYTTPIILYLYCK